MAFGTMYCAGKTPALITARRILSQKGISFDDSPGWNIRHLLFDVPSFRPGLWSDNALETLLASLPHNVTIWGGNLRHPALESWHTVDLLQDESYLQGNADITAACTIPIAESALQLPWNKTNALIIGWGRIGKSLSGMLCALGCHITILTRSACHKAEAASSGFSVIDAPDDLQPFHLIINTAPAHVLSVQDVSPICIDLASVRGIIGENVIWARGLPGRFAPEQSGKLIADTILRLSKEVCP